MTPFFSLTGEGREDADSRRNEEAENIADASNDVFVKCRLFILSIN
jgi:hypothetical protein